MERESRHSKEEEEELDRKIAQIREKNQRIEERQKVSSIQSPTFAWCLHAKEAFR